MFLRLWPARTDAPGCEVEWELREWTTSLGPEAWWGGSHMGWALSLPRFLQEESIPAPLWEGVSASPAPGSVPAVLSHCVSAGSPSLLSGPSTGMPVYGLAGLLPSIRVCQYLPFLSDASPAGGGLNCVPFFPSSSLHGTFACSFCCKGVVPVSFRLVVVLGELFHVEIYFWRVWSPTSTLTDCI